MIASCNASIGILLMIAAGWGHPVWAEDVRVDPSTHRAAWRFFDSSDGLVDGSVRAIETAADGRIWFAGRLGVSVYDGRRWTRIPNGPVACHDIAAAADGSIWVASADGLFRIHDEQVTPVAVPLWQGQSRVPLFPVRILKRGTRLYVAFGSDPSLKEHPSTGIGIYEDGKWELLETEGAIGTRFLNDISLDRDGTLWVATDEGTATLRNGHWDRSGVSDNLPAARVHAVYVTSSGVPWAATAEGLAYNHEGKWAVTHLDGGLRARTLGDSEEFRRPPPPATSFAETSDGVLWTFGGGALHAWTRNRWVRKEIPLPGPGDLTGTRYRIHVSGGDVIWSPGFRVSRFDYGGNKWRSHVGIAGPPYEDPDGRIWFRKQNGRTLTIGLAGESAHNEAGWPVLRDRAGTLWSAGEGRITTHADEGRQTVHTTSGQPQIAFEQSDGSLWFVSQSEAVRLTREGSIQTHDSNAWGADVPLGRHILEDSSGVLWFVPDLDQPARGYGLVSFDGTKWQRHTFTDLFPDRPYDTELQSRIYDLTVTGDGDLYAGTWEGIWARESGTWRFLDDPGMPWDTKATKILYTSTGDLWVACAAVAGGFSGILRRSGGTWSQIGPDDGLAGSDVWELAEDNRGRIWVGTTTGASVFDGRGWTSLEKSDGLLEDDVRFIHCDRSGNIWMGKGRHFNDSTWWVTRYDPDTAPPETAFTYLPPTELPESAVVTFGWEGIDAWKDTPGDGFTYAWRINKGPWTDFLGESAQSFRGLTPGTHRFEVVARDLDGNADPSPAAFTVAISAPVWRQLWFWILILSLVTVVIIQAIRISRARIRALQSELDTARDLQMDLMPTESPDIPGYTIAGKCIPASEVGGDFFNYYWKGNRFLFGLADVTGKAMEAAIPVVMFSGILESVAHLPGALVDMLKQLNRTLCNKLDARKFVCFVVGELNTQEHTLELADCGCPFPYLYRAATGRVEEIPLGAYPLGIRQESDFGTADLLLSSGDCIIFCSDGIPEAEVAPDQQLGYENTIQIVEMACRKENDARSIMDRILEEVGSLTRRQPQTDDLTCVVLRVDKNTDRTSDLP